MLFSYIKFNFLLIAGESGHDYNCTRFINDIEFNDTEIEDFRQGFINADDPDDDQHFLDEGNMDDLTSSPSFEVVEDIKINHGMLVSTRQVANTFFYQTVPSQTIKVHKNAVSTAPSFQFQMEKAESSDHEARSYDKGNRFFRKFNAFAKGKCMEIMRASSAILCMIMLLLMHSLYLEEDHIIHDKLGDGLITEKEYCTVFSRRGKPREKLRLLDKAKANSWNDFGLLWKKLGFFITISLVVCTSLY